MIIGLTDKVIFRRVGKIRAGYVTEDKKMVNTPYFLLHDAPQLIPVLGEKPTELYFAAHSNNYQKFFQDDLRWYTKNELMCVSTHELNKPPTAAYLSFQDVPGVKQNQHPRYLKARERSCLYKTCPQYLEGRCGEHFFLDMIIPQYSMGPIFQLDNTSLLAIINIHAAIQSAVRANLGQGGRIQGEIFKLYKKEIAVSFTDFEKMKKYNRDQAVIHMEHVPFEVYEKTFKDKISPENWAALVGLRSGAVTVVDELAAPEEVAQLEGPKASLPSPSEQAFIEAAIKARANDPTVVKLIAELASLTNVPNSEENRIKLARSVTPPTVEGIVSYVKARIQKCKKADVAPESETAKPPVAASQPEKAATNQTLF